MTYRHQYILIIASMVLFATSAIAEQANSMTEKSCLPSSVMGVATPALIRLSTEGEPDLFQKQLGGGKITDSAVLAKKLGAETLAKLLDVSKGEHLAAKALINTPNGDWYAMVHPDFTADNFVVLDKCGKAHRMDVGFTEGNWRPFVLR